MCEVFGCVIRTAIEPSDAIWFGESGYLESLKTKYSIHLTLHREELISIGLFLWMIEQFSDQNHHS